MECVQNQMLSTLRRCVQCLSHAMTGHARTATAIGVGIGSRLQPSSQQFKLVKSKSGGAAPTPIAGPLNRGRIANLPPFQIKPYGRRSIRNWGCALVRKRTVLLRLGS